MSTGEKQPYLRIKRKFNVSPETVFDTLTDPDLMRIWWGEDVKFDIDLKVGGKYTIIRTEGSVEYLATGEYLNVERPLFLQYTFGMPQFSPNNDIITIQIEKDNDGSFIIFEHSGEDIAAELRDLPDGENSPSETGWQQGFDMMAEVWSKSG